jgi:hypothetical protein
MILGVVAWLALFRSPGYVPPPLPDPNGFDDFVEARSLFASPAWNWDEVESTALKEMVAGQAQALSVMRQGFLKECRVPMSDSEEWLPALTGVKSLAQALCAEARLAQEEERMADAAKSCIDMFRLADAATSGGVLIHALVRGATDGIAESQVRVLMPELSSDEARQIASRLEQILSDREPFKVMQKREAEWPDPSMTLTWWLKNAIAAKSLQPFKQMNQRAQQKCMQCERLVLRLLLDLASQAYELEQGHPPESADQLVPDYLKAVPADPLTGDPMEL